MEKFPGAFRPVGKTFTCVRDVLSPSVAVAGIVVALATSAYGQTSGSISGHVADPQGAAVPVTSILLKNVDTGAERTTVTTSTGDYTFTEVPIGSYVVSAQHAGFKTSSSSALDVQIGQSVRLDVHLEIGAISETVEVSTAGTLLQSENAATGTVIGNEELTELPLNGRNYLGLVALSSNVNTLSQASGQAGSRLGGDRANQSIAVGGQRIMFNYFTLDGVNNTDPDFNTYIGLPSPDAIQEMKVQTGVYSAEFGHEASQVNVVTKGGTNKYHGTAYEFIRNNFVDARPYWFPQRQAAGAVQQINPFKYNDFGFELDGPIRIPKLYNGKDKFFFMVSKEWFRSRSSNPNATATVPTAAMAGGDFRGYSYQYVDPSGAVRNAPVTIYDPSTGNANGTGRQPFPNNIIPAGRISKQTTALLKYLGTAASLPTYNCPAKVTTNTNCAAVPNYRYSTTSPSNRESLYVRGDYNWSDRTQISFRYGQGDGDSLNTGLLGAGSKTITQYQQYMGSLTHTFSPTVVNETRFGYSNFFNSLGLVSAFTTDVVSSLGIPGLTGGDPATWGIPSVSFSNFAVSGVQSSGAFGTAPAIWTGFGDQGGDGPYVLRDPSWQIVDNVTLIRGKHSLRLGYEFNRQTFNQLGNQFSRGQFSAQPLTTSFYTGTTLTGGDSLADLLLGNLQQSVVAVAVANANDVRNVQAGYVDDTFKGARSSPHPLACDTS
ncbi:TonB-dependent receptor [Terriglobus roseus]|uniref:TonB-dependent receptor n=1 Tax=Terriglobus roseus TaxID=392734 RepID=UPI000310E36B|nr:carboxypeptidase-like regulatory domain-containing protein [Terriglobus roseus]